ncbi:cysteine desulfurase, related [Neospora caninum Liverpool]|uniref:cysteine desulfurase n=1 Tax=Neospora caninum (strain Liverpool) TaxID=572307 RepID=F0V9V0_NEOCL|nr:cysteine desulfurase, related [Neospora caninum Liverpool]CBZ50712.1 cysteine desulfurase, related [Neospora caninum Liverpool]CEL65323.1 TPA: Cysteine desulfurase, related [Neospora caninum Liverpool]|eukprot:XP_003880745.1 cysteine desulfurase, related [Neospora caninum Liverpool]
MGPLSKLALGATPSSTRRCLRLSSLRPLTSAAFSFAPASSSSLRAHASVRRTSRASAFSPSPFGVPSGRFGSLAGSELKETQPDSFKSDREKGAFTAIRFIATSLHAHQPSPRATGPRQAPDQHSHRSSFLTSSSASFSSSAASSPSQASEAAAVGREDVQKEGPIVAARPVYLDNQATTVQDPRVTDAMLPFLFDKFGNPHSSSHAIGWEADAAVEKARVQVAQLLGLDASRAREIIFTSGATESNNLALKGAVHYYCRQHPVTFRKGDKGKERREARVRNHIITTQLEHKCALQCCRMLHLEFRDSQQTRGCDVTFLPVKADGLIDLAELESAIRPETLLVSVMFVNNEIGVVQNLEKIGEICRKHDVLFHTDAAQGAGKLPIDVDKMGIDMLSLSGHKIYGPKGIGALFVRAKNPRVRLQPIIDGGGQERGLRSGTLATPLCVGLGAACELASSEMENDRRHVTRLAQLLLDSVREKVPDIEVNGSLTSRYPGNLNISFTFVEGESVLMSIRDVAISSGSACTSASLEPSYVLRALGVGEEVAHTSLRFGIGRFTREEDVRRCVDRLVAQIHRLRELSPLYEMEMAKRKALASGICPNDETDGAPLIWT